eukprot:366244-Chlamydomonas_euryale.AAC.8
METLLQHTNCMRLHKTVLGTPAYVPAPGSPRLSQARTPGWRPLPCTRCSCCTQPASTHVCGNTTFGAAE